METSCDCVRDYRGLWVVLPEAGRPWHAERVGELAVSLVVLRLVVAALPRMARMLAKLRVPLKNNAGGNPLPPDPS